jgi:hypothetical protein
MTMKKLVIDVVERAAATYAVAFLGLVLADGFDLTSLGDLKAAGVAALPAALSVIKGFFGTLIGDKRSAAWLPKGKSE